MKNRFKVPAWRRLVLRMLRCKVHYTQTALRKLSSGPVIIVCNHVSMMDGILIALASPFPLVIGVEHRYAETHPYGRKLLRLLSTIRLGEFVSVSSAQPMGLKTLLASLKQGESVVIILEENVNGDGSLNENPPGQTWLSKRSGAAILNIRLRRTEHRPAFFNPGRKVRLNTSMLF